MKKDIILGAYFVASLSCFAEPSLEWDRAEDFSDGLALVTKIGRKGAKTQQGFIKQNGLFQIPLNSSWNSVTSFSDGVAFYKKGNLWGLIDKSGSEITEPIWESHRSGFVDGLAIVSVNGKFGFIDKEGKFAVEPVWQEALDFSDGLALVYEEMDPIRYGFVTKTGKVQIKPTWIVSIVDGLPLGGHDGMGWPTREFYEGLARVEIDKKFGFIDKDGEVVIEAKWDEAQPFSEGLAAVRHGERWGYIGKDGNIVIPPGNWIPDSPFYRGLAQVSAKGEDGKRTGGSGFIDKTGKVVIPLSYNPSYGGMHGTGFRYAEVLKVSQKDGEKFSGLLTAQGKVIPLPDIDHLFWERYSDGLIVARRDGSHWGFYDSNGKLIIPFTDAFSVEQAEFKEGLARVKLKNGNVGFIDKTGTVVIQPRLIEN